MKISKRRVNQNMRENIVYQRFIWNDMMGRMMREYGNIAIIRELIIDNSSQFGAHRSDEKWNWSSEFKILRN